MDLGQCQIHVSGRFQARMAGDSQLPTRHVTRTVVGAGVNRVARLGWYLYWIQDGGCAVDPVQEVGGPADFYRPSFVCSFLVTSRMKIG